MQVQISKHHRRAKYLSYRIDYVLPRDVKSGMPRTLRKKHILFSHACAGYKADTANYSRADVTQYRAIQVSGHYHIELARILD